MALIEINQGEPEAPWYDEQGLSETPVIHPSATVLRTRVGPWTSIARGCEITDSDFLDFAYATPNVQIFNAEIGKFCNIATNVRINPTNHPMWRATLHHFTYRSRCHHMAQDDDREIFEWRLKNRIVISPDVWIGHAAIIMPGVNVGTGAVIGSGAIVTKDVPNYAVVVGSPARVIKRRVDEETEARFLRIKWWDWSHARLSEAMADFRKLDAIEFSKRYDVAEAVAQV
ncbi:acetyltransferase [Flaviflagellibacter deserti]|uniref:Acetyltransferase n=1 Tax=Flaviflagellibacter deserti TaxID=2267266 RepID=A0ABV9Z0F3_9HYPH